MSGILLAFGGGIGYAVNFVVGTLSLHYGLCNFASGLAITYTAATALAIGYYNINSKRPRRDSTDGLMIFCAIAALGGSLAGLATPYAICRTELLFGALDQRIFAFFN